MKNKTRFNLWLALGLTLALGLGIVWLSGGVQAQGQAPQGTPLGTAFTYQGRLTDSTSGEPIAGPCDLKFSLYESLTGNDPVGTPQTKSGVTPDNGYFSVDLDFGADAFTGEGRFLKIEVDCGGGFTALDPRVSLTPAPYALALPGLRTQQTAFSPNVIGGYSGNSVAAGVSSATIGGGGVSGSVNQVTANYATVSGGYGNIAAGGAAAIGGGTENTASGYDSAVGGGENNIANANYATVGGGFFNKATDVVSTVGGGYYNTASGEYATVGGGGSNTASGLAATIGGGYRNTAAYTSTVSGGYENTASGTTATIGGGQGNTASGNVSTIGGGYNNTASDMYATVGGGADNTSDSYATVGGGYNNTASSWGATVPGGMGADASLYGQWAYAGGEFTSAGDAQASLYVMRAQTTNSGTWNDLYLDDGSSLLLTIAPTRTLTFDILVVGRSDAGESAGYYCWGTIENVGGTTTMIGLWCTPLGEDDAAWDAQVIADDGNDALAVQVMGNGENIRWVATVRAAEVAW